jgi:hypothetical protein
MDLNLSGKILFSILGCYFENGGKTNLKITGDLEIILVFTAALKATMEYKEELKNPYATIASISDKQKEKLRAGLEFEALTQLAWVL